MRVPALAGRLEVVLLSGFQPDLWDEFDVLDWDTVEGAIGGYSLPALDGGRWCDTSDFDSTGVIRVVPEPAALLALAAGGMALLRGRRR